MPLFKTPRRHPALAAALILATANPLLAGDFVWSPPVGSDSQWTDPLNWTSLATGTPTAMDTAHFTQLTSQAASPIVRAHADPVNTPPTTSVLTVGGIIVHGFFSYDNAGVGLTGWRIELARFAFDSNVPTDIVATPFTLDLNSGNGVIQMGHFEAPPSILDPAIAIPGGLTITGKSTFDNQLRSAAVGFRGTLDVRHGRLRLEDVNYDDHDPLSSVGGVVDSRDDLSYIPQRLPNAELSIDHSHFNAFKSRGLLIGSIGRATASLQNDSILSNLKELRIGGNSLLGQESHERSTLTMTDSHITVGDGVGGSVYVGDDAAPDLIDVFNGTMTMTRSSLAPSVIRDNLGVLIGVEPLDVQVGHFGSGQLLVNDLSSISARRLFVGEKPSGFGEMRMNASHLALSFPSGPETADHAGRWSLGKQGIGFAVVAGAAGAPSTIDARSLTIGEAQNAYGDLYLDRDTSLTLASTAAIGIGGQGRLTLTGRFTGLNSADQRNLYATSTATIGIRPALNAMDPSRAYGVNVGTVLAAAGFLIVGEGARLNVTDQPLAGTDELDPFGVERWRATDHRLAIGDDGLGVLTVHADALVRGESLRVGETSVGIGHVVLLKAMLNSSAANQNFAVPGTLKLSRGAVIGVHGIGTLTIRGQYVKRIGLLGPGGEVIVDAFDDYGLLTASLTIGDGTGSNGAARVYDGGQIRVEGTIADERDLVVARDGAGLLEVSNALVLNNGGPATYASGATGGTVRVVNGMMRVGGADAVALPAAKGQVIVYPNGLIEANQLKIGGAGSSGDTFTTRAGAEAIVTLPGGGTESHTFAGGSVRVGSLQMLGNSTLAIESNPVAVGDPRDGGFRVEGVANVDGGTLRLGKTDRSSTGTLLASQLNFSAGQLIGGGTIDGNLVVAGGAMVIQINGTTRFTGYDSFDVSGNATFTSGSVLVNAGTHLGLIGERFEIFTFAAGSRTTLFDVTNTLASQPGTQWVSYLDGNSYTLAVAGATGDTNFDGAVNFDDLLTLAQHYNEAGPQSWITGDFNDDQLVNFDDLLTLAQNYGSNLLGESTTLNDSFALDWQRAQVVLPEPTSAALLASAAAGLGRRRYCRRIPSKP